MRIATVIPMSIQRMVCTGCGAEANASCNCGVSYMPKAERAREAVKANPEKSDRAIAKEIGVDHKTVGTARKELTGENSPVERIGLDGKVRRLPQRPEEECEDCDTAEDFWYRGLSSRAGDAIAGASFIHFDPDWKRQFKVTSELVTLAKQAAEAWEELADVLEAELHK